MIRRLLDMLYFGAGVLAALFLLAIFAMMLLLPIGRETGFNIPSGDDFTGWALVAMSFLGLAHTFKRGEMIRVTLLLERLHGAKRRIAELFALSVGIAFLAYFTWQCVILAHDSWRFNDMSTGVVSVPLWIPQFGMVLGLALLLIAMIDELVIVLGGGRPTYEPEPAKTAEELVERVAQGGGV
jgi:TRAP-type C4-dicarboxylate transport system permease small subunit